MRTHIRQPFVPIDEKREALGLVLDGEPDVVVSLLHATSVIALRPLVDIPNITRRT